MSQPLVVVTKAESTAILYTIWFLSFFGMLGFHCLYLGDIKGFLLRFFATLTGMLAPITFLVGLHDAATMYEKVSGNTADDVMVANLKKVRAMYTAGELSLADYAERKQTIIVRA